jgi:hypothetical protein
MDFSLLKKAIYDQFQKMVETGLYRVNAEPDALWEWYLASFPTGSNPIFIKRTEHDCSACRSFIKKVGGVVTIVNNKIVTLWDVKVDDPAYQTVVDAMAAFVRTYEIDNVFRHTEGTVGIDKNYDTSDKSSLVWQHLFTPLPLAVVKRGIDIGPEQSECRGSFNALLNGLKEITKESVDKALEWIEAGVLYRGDEQKFALTNFRTLQHMYGRLSEEEKIPFVWAQSVKVHASVAKIKNTAVGTLLADLSTDMDEDEIVKRWEKVMDARNFKRSTAPVTPTMIKKAKETIEELGYESALVRRYATINDITINNLIFVDKKAKQEMGVFEEMIASAPAKKKNFDYADEVSIEEFIANIVPQSKTIEVMVENRHANNFVTLVAPEDKESKSMFKWPNNFSWSYTGDVTDSIKERVKAAGGNVTGDFRASLSWHNYDDLDLHLKGPKGMHIYFSFKNDVATGGKLDVDMNAGGGYTRKPVENIVFPKRSRMTEGEYHLFVHQFSKRENVDLGFEVEMEFDGVVHNFVYPQAVSGEVTVCKFSYSHKEGLKILSSLPSTQAPKTVWNVQTQTFTRVRVMMLSPNYWDDKAVGNKHYFFMLDGCKNDGQVRGFFNEFLNESLTPHRKVLEIVGSKMKTEASDNQLSGVGFSSTQRNQLVAKVTGASTRVVKINF